MNHQPAIPSLDLFTVKVMALMTAMVVSCWSLLAWKLNQRLVGMGRFAVGLLLFTLGTLLGLGRLLIPGNPIVIACNVLAFAGMINVAQGIRAIRGFPALKRSSLAVLAVTAAVFFSYWLFIENNFGRRVGVMSVAFIFLSLDASASMFRRVASRDRLIYWPTGFAFAFTASYLAMRAVGAFSGAYGSSLLSPVPVELASAICANVAYIGCGFGMLLASNTQLRCDAERMAQFDPLTNLPNRRFVLDRLLDAERRALSSGRRLGVVYLDLDGFKRINDTLGHDTGDDLLKRVSAAMASVLRADDCLGRMGGDEFVVVVESIGSRDELMALAERLRSAVEEVPVGGETVATMRVSCGAALFPEDALTAHDVMREADAAMYHAKRTGRVAEELEPIVVETGGFPLSTGYPGRRPDASAAVN